MSDVRRESQEADEMRYSNKIYISFGIGGFMENFFVAAFTVRIYHFYETELLLATILIGAALIIFGLWYMVNDSILDYLSDRKTRFTARRGRRFTWFVIGAVLYPLIYLIVFVVPVGDQVGMFLWFLITICIFELFFTLWQINYLALYPEKLRSNKERTRIEA